MSRVDAAVPRGAVTRDHPVDVESAQRSSEAEDVRLVVGERCRLRPGDAGEHVPRRQLVADEHRADLGHVHRDAAGRVARHRDDARGAGQVQHVAVVRPAAPPAAAGCGRRPCAPRRRRSRASAPTRIASRGVAGGFAPFARSASAAPMYTGMPSSRRSRSAKPMWSLSPCVSTMPRMSLSGRPSAASSRRRSRVVAGQAGVDEGDALVGDDEVGGDDVVAETVESGGELHDGYDN